MLGLGGEHTVSYGLAKALAKDLRDLTIIVIDAHPDLLDRMFGLAWAHGTVMRRLWDGGARIVQIGLRSISLEERAMLKNGERIQSFLAHRLQQDWDHIIASISAIKGSVYLSLDVDGLDPSIIWSTGTPQPGGLGWNQVMGILHAIVEAKNCHLIGADVVEYVADPHPPGCDIVAAKLAAKVISCWAAKNGLGRPED